MVRRQHDHHVVVGAVDVHRGERDGGRGVARRLDEDVDAGQLGTDERLVPLVRHDRHVHGHALAREAVQPPDRGLEEGLVAEQREERLRPLRSRQRPQARATAPRHHDHVHRAILGTGAPARDPGDAGTGSSAANTTNLDRLARPNLTDSNHRAGGLVDAVHIASYHPRTVAGGAAGPTDPRSAVDHVGDAGHAPARARRRPARPSPCRRAPTHAETEDHAHAEDPHAVPDVAIVNVTKRFEDVVAVDAMNLSVASGAFYSFLGPSGCGKTTTLRMIAGFEQPTAGEIYLAGSPVAGVPPYRRNVNTVFQHYALFPHMNVAQNVGYGLRQRKVVEGRGDAPGRRGARAGPPDRVRATRRTWELSGGQQQRVALARALVNHPTVLLLDEPLGALDRKLRNEMQIELKQLQREVGITFIYVTHDQEEALTMSDVIVVMRDGRIQQQGQPEDLYQRPVEPRSSPASSATRTSSPATLVGLDARHATGDGRDRLGPAIAGR